MGAIIQLTADDGHVLDAYRSAPAAPSSKALVVIQEIFGVNNHIKGLCDRFAEEGYLCLAPALFDRNRKGVELDYSEESVTEGRALKDDMGWDRPMLDVEAAVDALEGVDKVGVVGYCWGGSLAWLAACRLDIDAAVGYYGGQIIQFVGETPRCHTLLHFGTKDSGIPLADVSEIRETHPDVAVHLYEGAQHGFSCDERGSYDQASAELARERSMAHFARHLS